MGVVRLLLAVLVFNSHWPFLDRDSLSGHQAVELFFLISGFYMSLVLTERYATASAFYRSRARRLLPAYWTVLALSVACLWLWDFHPLTGWTTYSEMLTEHPVQGLLFGATQVLVVGQEWLFGMTRDAGGHFMLASDLMGDAWRKTAVIQSWSLSLEIMFYALAPLLARLRTGTLAVLLGASLALRVGADLHGIGLTGLGTRLFPLEAWLFLAGMLSHRTSLRITRIPARLDGPALALLLTAIAAAGLVPEPVRLPLLALMTWAAMPLVFRLVRDNRVDRFVGEITYPFYLMHYLVIAVLEQSLAQVTAPLLLGVTFLAALALWWAIIRPWSRPAALALPARPPALSPELSPVPAAKPSPAQLRQEHGGMRTT